MSQSINFGSVLLNLTGYRVVRDEGASSLKVEYQDGTAIVVWFHDATQRGKALHRIREVVGAV